MDINDELLQQICEMAAQGATVVEVIDVIHRTLDVKPYSRGLVMIYFRRAYLIPINDLSTIGGWIAFGDGGTLSTSETNETFTRVIENTKTRWLSGRA